MSFKDLKPGNVAEYLAGHRSDTALWFLHHVPKTAGSSLADELAARLRPYRNMAIDYKPDTESTGDLVGAAVTRFIDSGMARECRSASGHVLPRHVAQIAEAVPDVRFVTYLRHPVSRVVSEYRYCRTEMHPPWRRFIERYPTLGDFVSDRTEANKMSLYLLPDRGMPVDEAVDYLLERYAFIGLQERYPLCFRLMADMMWGGSVPRSRSRVTSSTSENAVEMTSEIHQKILQHNQKDLALYKAIAGIYADIADEAWKVLETRPPAG